MNRGIVQPTGDTGALVLNGIKTFAKKHKIISTSYLFGIAVILFGGSGLNLSLKQRREYNRIMNTIDLDVEFDSSNNYHRANQAYRASKGWFTCDSLCQRNKRRMEESQKVLDSVRKEGYNRMSDAKSVAGLFSEVGVSEVRDSFWEYFASGKRFAKRQTMWDAMFIGMRSMSRDENMMEYLFKVLLQVLMNFSIGLCMALLFFIFGLWNIIKSYQPNPLSAVAFFVSAVCAGFAFVLTYLMIMYGAVIGGVYGMAKMAENNRLEGQRRRQFHNRPHSD